MPKLTKNDVLKKAEELKNWGKWGPDDELGVLNYITPQDIVNAARLVKRGKVFRLGLELDENGPQRGIFGGRWSWRRTKSRPIAVSDICSRLRAGPGNRRRISS